MGRQPRTVNGPCLFVHSVPTAGGDSKISSLKISDERITGCFETLLCVVPGCLFYGGVRICWVKRESTSFFPSVKDPPLFSPLFTFHVSRAMPVSSHVDPALICGSGNNDLPSRSSSCRHFCKRPKSLRRVCALCCTNFTLCRFWADGLCFGHWVWHLSVPELIWEWVCVFGVLCVLLPQPKTGVFESSDRCGCAQVGVWEKRPRKWGLEGPVGVWRRRLYCHI